MRYLIKYVRVDKQTGVVDLHNQIIEADSPNEALEKLFQESKNGTFTAQFPLIEEAGNREICEECNKVIEDLNGFINYDGEIICEECGDAFLDAPDILSASDYPYIDVDSGDWDGGMFDGVCYRRLDD